MIITPRYIKMCWKARELQEEWVPTAGDCYWLGPDYVCDVEACRILTDDPVRFALFKRGQQVWLPTQEQLQRRLGCAFNLTTSTLMEIVELRQWYERKFKMKVIAATELWLMFYMKKKHQKVWEPVREEWVKE